MESPCVKVCIINPESGFCEGCARTLKEIAQWTRFSPADRSRIMMELERRKAGAKPAQAD
jgi:uncharacterized protein